MTVACDSRPRPSLTPVALSVLPVGKDLPFNVYFPTEDGPAALLVAKHRPLSAAHVDALSQRGVRTLYIPTEEAEQFTQFLLEKVIRDETRAPQERFELLRDAMQSVFRESFRNGDLETMLTTSKDYGAQLAEIIQTSDVLFVDLVGVMAHDYSNFTHATNVATNSLLLAAAFGIDGQEDLFAIAQGALLHDVGKRFVSKAILHKRSPLNTAEREAIKEHPARGFQMLCRQAGFRWDPLMMVYQHHERYDGRGYPVGLVGKEIHPWARICAIADVFDALTRDRPYRGAVGADEVLAYLDRETGRGFDEDLVQCWISVVTKKR